MDVGNLVAKANAEMLSSSAMDFATTTTITVDAIGTAVTVVVQKDLTTVPNANAKTAITKLWATNALKTLKGRAKNYPLRETGIATMITTTPVAPGMEEIAVGTRTTTNFARNASARTAHSSLKAINAPNKLRVLVVQRVSAAMATAIIQITTPDVTGMKAIAVVLAQRPTK